MAVEGRSPGADSDTGVVTRTSVKSGGQPSGGPVAPKVDHEPAPSSRGPVEVEQDVPTSSSRRAQG